MNNTSRYIPSHIRIHIAIKAESGEKYQNIIEEVEEKYNRKVNKGTISKIVQKFEETGSTEDLPRSCRPEVFTKRQQDMIIEEIKKDPKLTAVDISRNRKLNKPGATQTIRNLLDKEGWIASAGLSQSISYNAIEKRFQFASKYVEKPEFWSTVIFSDEADLYPYKSGKLYIGRYRGEHPLVTYNMPSKWDLRVVKVLGCINPFGVGSIVRYWDNMDHAMYIDILKE